MTSLTISTLLTPPGAGAIAVIQVSGPDALRIADQAFTPNGARRFSESRLGELRYGRLMDGGETLDDIVACRVAEGHACAVEICAHGGVRVVERILSLFERLGAPLCDDKDLAIQIWSPRNLIEVEALHAMPVAKTERALRFTAWQRKHLAAHLQNLADECVSVPDLALAELTRLLETFAGARLLLSGATAAIVGPPNSGKSTLFNHLLGRVRAVVSPVAGTTRDWIEEAIEIDGAPIRLIDTAGRRADADQLEVEAIRSGSNLAENADLLLLVLDQSVPIPDLSSFPCRPTIVIANKSDLPSAWQLGDVEDLFNHEAIRVSASTGVGIPKLVSRMKRVAGLNDLTDQVSAIFTQRQAEFVDQAQSVLRERRAAGAAQIIKQKLIGSNK